MTLTIREKDEKISKRKGLIASGALVASIGIGILASPVLGVVGLVPTAYLAYDWFKFRAKRGMRI